MLRETLIDMVFDHFELEEVISIKLYKDPYSNQGVLIIVNNPEYCHIEYGTNSSNKNEVVLVGIKSIEKLRKKRPNLINEKEVYVQ